MCDWSGGTYAKTSLEASALFRHADEKQKLTAGRQDGIGLNIQLNIYADMAELADALASARVISVISC